MKLTASFTDGVIEVDQQGGYGPESKIVLRSVAQGAECDKGVTWRYPYSTGAILALKEAAELLEADLVLDSHLRAVAQHAINLTSQEHAVRKLIQKYIDEPTLPVATYPTTPAPPPWRHQMVAYHWALRVSAIYLAHKPGLGKTREGVDIIRGRMDLGHVRQVEQVWVDGHYSEVHPSSWIDDHWAIRGGVLVVCPRVVLGTWFEELWRFQEIAATVVYSSNRQAKLRRGGTPTYVHITTYDSLEVIEDNQYDGIIADELHYLANDDTKRFARMQHLRQHAKWVVGLSGTPVSNMLPSLWAQYYWLDGGRTLGPSFEGYRRRYFHGSGRSLEARVDAERNIAKQISRITYFLTMPEAFPDKARKIQQVHRVPMTSEQLTYYERLRKQTAADILTGTVTTDMINVRLLKLMQVCQGFVIDDEGTIQIFSSAKLRALKDMLTGTGDLTDRRTIVWCRFRHDLAQVSELLTKHQIPHLTLHGDTKDKEAVRDVWNSDASKRVLVGMIQMGIGINLHAPKCVDDQGRPARCSTTVFYGLDWRVTQLEQAMDRTYRGDQVETCLYRYLLSEDLDASYGGRDDRAGDPVVPMDMRVYQTLQQKLEQATLISEESMDYVRRLVE